MKRKMVVVLVFLMCFALIADTAAEMSDWGEFGRISEERSRGPAGEERTEINLTVIVALGIIFVLIILLILAFLKILALNKLRDTSSPPP